MAKGCLPVNGGAGRRQMKVCLQGVSMNNNGPKRALRGRAGRMQGGRGSGRASKGMIRLWGRHAVEARGRTFVLCTSLRAMRRIKGSSWNANPCPIFISTMCSIRIRRARSWCSIK